MSSNPAPRRWTTEVQVGWELPLLTFNRRREQLLDWLEQHADVTEFRDNDDLVGIALGDADQRFVLHRGGLTIELLSEGAEMLPLEVLEALWRICEPKSAVLDGVLATMTVELAVDYKQACAHLADRSAPGSDFLRPQDTAILLDSETKDGHYLQTEFGIVEAQELRQRVMRPSFRLHRPPSGAPDGPRARKVTAFKNVPAVALFTDNFLRTTQVIEGADDLVPACTYALEQMEGAVVQLAAPLLSWTAGIGEQLSGQREEHDV